MRPATLCRSNMDSSSPRGMRISIGDLGAAAFQALGLAGASGRWQVGGLAAEATLALLVGADRAQEVDLPERRPVRVAEVELAVGALPQEEAGEPDLAAGADDEVRVGEVGRVEILADRLLGDALDDRLHVFALLVLLAQHRLHRVDDLLASAVGEGDRQV